MKSTIKFAKDIRSAGGVVYAVGGYVRDHRLGETPTDIDLVAFKVSEQTLSNVCSEYNGEKIGKDFPVYLIETSDFGMVEVAMPRTEESTGEGYHDFTVNSSENITLEEDAERRDFTCNAMYENILTGTVYDFFDGGNDIKLGLLHPVAGFSEDHTRVLRAVRFALKYGWNFSPELIRVMGSMSKTPFVPERLGLEFRKIAKQTTCGYRHRMYVFDVLNATGWLELFSPELKRIWDMPFQFTIYHNESFKEHVMMVWEQTQIYNMPPVLGFVCAIMHDSYKPSVQKWDSERHKFTYHGHENIPFSEFEKFTAMNIPKQTVELAYLICVSHMKVKETMRAAQALKLYEQFDNGSGQMRMRIKHLVQFTKADNNGRISYAPYDMSVIIKYQNAWEKWHRYPDKITGNHLIAAGIKPDKNFKQKLFQEHLGQFKKFYKD